MGLGRAVALALAAMLLGAPAPGHAQDVDRLLFSAEGMGHVPAPLTADGRATLGQTHPWLHEVALAYGVGIGQLGSDVLLRVGYRFGHADLLTPTHDPGGTAAGLGDSIDLTACPISLGWRLTLLPYPVRPLLGLDVGGALSSLQVSRPGQTPTPADWRWGWGVRGIAGVHWDLAAHVGLRGFVEARWAQAVLSQGTADVAMSGFGAGLAILVSMDRVGSAAWAAPGPSAPPLLKDYGTADTRLERAFVPIRAADEARNRGDFVAAERFYAEGIGLLPQDAETRRNVEIPVRLDWARTLVQVGRRYDALAVVDAALAIDPRNHAAVSLRQKLTGKRR